MHFFFKEIKVFFIHTDMQGKMTGGRGGVFVRSSAGLCRCFNGKF